MKAIRQKRQSCESCRARKLKCSGEQSGCSRCRALSLTCKFQDKRRAGRPRKQPQQEQQEEQESQGRRDCGLSSGEPRSSASCCSPPLHVPSMSHGSTDSREAQDMVTGNGNCGPFPVDLSGDIDLGSFPIDFLEPCHPTGTHGRDLAGLSSDAPFSPALLLPSCNCAQEVSETVRALRRAPLSHSIIRDLRVGADLAERLLTCPVCYDWTKSPRITIQNVMLLSRLIFEITSSYHRYMRWLKDSCNELSGRGQRETVYLIPGIEISPVVGFKVSGDKFQHLIMHGLQADAERLSALARRFAQRQRNRHMVGHEACPNAEGRCWKEEQGVDLDPLDICPQNSAAQALTPCYRIVDEVAATIKQLADAVA